MARSVSLVTTFSHSAHLSLLNPEGCLSCHSLDREADVAVGFKDRDPATFASNFKPIGRNACTDCHTETQAGDRCLACHNYHIGIIPPAMISAPEIMAKPAAK